MLACLVVTTTAWAAWAEWAEWAASRPFQSHTTHQKHPGSPGCFFIGETSLEREALAPHRLPCNGKQRPGQSQRQKAATGAAGRTTNNYDDRSSGEPGHKNEFLLLSLPTFKTKSAKTLRRGVSGKAFHNAGKVGPGTGVRQALRQKCRPDP